MPSAETLQRFIARVEENAHAEAVEEFYTANASMQENQQKPRVGRDVHIANERAVLARAKTVMSKCVRPIFVDGDYVVIRWIFRFDWLDGTVTQMEELAYQRWEGERIAEETFFYDPAQRVPRKLTAAESRSS
ncbi:MAG: nuclear transport factor 2 family protein [Burkholderiaceae bacterium]|nr:nuclear transport factor 2 family protein [Burkholderiaceae bacterium]